MFLPFEEKKARIFDLIAEVSKLATLVEVKNIAKSLKTLGRSIDIVAADEFLFVFIDSFGKLGDFHFSSGRRKHILTRGICGVKRSNGSELTKMEKFEK